MTNYAAFIPLIITYLGIAGYMSWRIAKILVNKHKRTGYNAFFHYFSLLWALMRALFWTIFVARIDTSQVAFSLLFSLPQSIQYLTFALLAVYLARMAARRKWETGGWRKTLFTVYVLVAVFSIIGTITLAFLSEYAEVPEHCAEDYWSVFELLGNGALFLFLGAAFSILAWKMRHIRRDAFRRMFLFRQSITLSIIAIIGVCFFSRSIYNFVSYANVFRIDIDSEDAVVKVYLLYLVWEFFPFGLLLATIAGGPQATDESQQHFPDSYKYGVFSALVGAHQTDLGADDEYAAYGDLTNEGILEDQDIPLLRDSSLPPLVTSSIHDNPGGKSQSPLMMGLSGSFSHSRNATGGKTQIPQSPSYKKPGASVNVESVAKSGTDGGLGSSGGLLFSAGERGSGLGFNGAMGIRGDMPAYLGGSGGNQYGGSNYNMPSALHQGGMNRMGSRTDFQTDLTTHSSHNMMRNYSSNDFGGPKSNPFSMSLPQMHQMPPSGSTPGVQAFSPVISPASHSNLSGHLDGRDSAVRNLSYNVPNSSQAFSHSGYVAKSNSQRNLREHI